MVVNDDSHVGIGAFTTPEIEADGLYGGIVVKNATIADAGEIGRVGSYRSGESLRFWAATETDEVGMDSDILDLFKSGSHGHKRVRLISIRRTPMF